MRRRARLVVTMLAAAVIVASLVLARVLSLSSDREGLLAVAQAGLFLLFAAAALTLFAAVVMDFDRWVDTVRPVPKRMVRRAIGRGVRRVCRLVGWALALYGAVVSWLWLTVGVALGWVLRASSASLTWLWASAVRAGASGLVGYRAAAGWSWRLTGRVLAWGLGWSGVGLTWLWAWGVRGSEWLLVQYRAGAGWLWRSAGRVLAWTLAGLGADLTWLWGWLTRAGVRALVVYRTAMRRLWRVAGRAFVWPLARIGTALTWLWSRIARAGAWILVLCGLVILRSWWAVVGRQDTSNAEPLRRWYGAAVDSAFGIPPEDSVDAARRRRAARRPMPANRPRLQHPSFRDGVRTAGSRNAAGATSESDVMEDPRAHYVGRQVTRRGQRRKSEELLSAALARFRAPGSQPRDRRDRGGP